MMTSRSWIASLFFALVVYGGVVGYFATLDRDPPRALDLIFTVATVVLLYLWYYFDAEEHQFKRTPLLGGCVILFSLVAVPYYLIRSRKRGNRLLAVLKFIGLLVLSAIAVLVGGLPIVLLHGGA